MLRMRMRLGGIGVVYGSQCEFVADGLSVSISAFRWMWESRRSFLVRLGERELCGSLSVETVFGWKT